MQLRKDKRLLLVKQFGLKDIVFTLWQVEIKNEIEFVIFIYYNLPKMLLMQIKAKSGLSKIFKSIISFNTDEIGFSFNFSSNICGSSISSRGTDKWLAKIEPRCENTVLL